MLILTACSSIPYEKNRITDSIGGTPDNIVLNYENRVQQYDESIVDSHMRIYIEIEGPWIVSVPLLKHPAGIYSVAPIEGTAVYLVRISEKGKILSYEKKLSAGLGLDSLAEEIIKDVKVEPAWLAGKTGESLAWIRISFRMDSAE